jgi:hypothetical protein
MRLTKMGQQIDILQLDIESINNSIAQLMQGVDLILAAGPAIIKAGFNINVQQIVMDALSSGSTQTIADLSKQTAAFGQIQQQMRGIHTVK